MVREQHVTDSESDTAVVAATLASRLRPGDAVLLYGSLGAGKTAFVRGILTAFDPLVEVTSPTYTLVNVYPTNPPVFHFDLYRLRDENDLLDVGFDEYLDANGIVLVEWAEKCGRLKPATGYSVSLEITGETSRMITIDRIGDAHIST
jgi:tRNA threonylcarbamoyladenosine biosynthesis protein TsaE